MGRSKLTLRSTLRSVAVRFAWRTTSRLPASAWGAGHRIPASHVNYRANIDALKRAGVDRIVSFSAVGSLREDLSPGTFVLVDQYVDRTNNRVGSFFGEGFVAHVSMADPVCSTTCDAIERAARSINLDIVRGGTYLVMNGPQFSTRAESELYRSWGCDVIGMTNMPEAKLARGSRDRLRHRGHGHRLRLLA